MVGSQLLSLVKAQPQLEAIRRLDGPQLGTLQSLQSRLSGGAERLERLRVPDELRATHDLVVGRLALRRERHAPARRRRGVRQRGPRVGGVVGGRRRADDAVARAAEHSRSARAAQAPVITPRTTRLVRVADLQAFRRALVGLACQGSAARRARPPRRRPHPRRGRAAACAPSRDRRLAGPRRTLVLPDFVPAGELVFRLGRAARRSCQPVLRDAEREALLGWPAAPRATPGIEPPFRLRPGPRGRDAALLRRAAASTRRTSTRSSAWRSGCSSRAPPTIAAPSGWCGRRAFSPPRFATSRRGWPQAGVDEHGAARAAARDGRRRARTGTSSWPWATARRSATGCRRRTGTCWRACPAWSSSTSS